MLYWWASPWDRYISLSQRLPVTVDGASYTCVLIGLSALVSPSSPTSEDVHCTAVNPYSPVAFRTIKVVSWSGLNWNTFSTIVTIKPMGAMLQRIALASSGVVAAGQLMRRLSRSPPFYILAYMHMCGFTPASFASVLALAHRVDDHLRIHYQ